MTDIKKHEYLFENFPPSVEELDEVIDKVIDYGETMINLVNSTYIMMRDISYKDELDERTKKLIEYYIKKFGTNDLMALYTEFDMMHEHGHKSYNELCAYREEQFGDEDPDPAVVEPGEQLLMAVA